MIYIVPGFTDIMKVITFFQYWRDTDNAGGTSPVSFHIETVSTCVDINFIMQRSPFEKPANNENWILNSKLMPILMDQCVSGYVMNLLMISHRSNDKALVSD